MKNKKLSALLAALLVLALALTGCSSDSGSTSTDSAADSTGSGSGTVSQSDSGYGTPQGNSMNNGYVTEYNGVTYYAPGTSKTVGGNAPVIYTVNLDDGELGLDEFLELPNDYPIVHPCLCAWDNYLYVYQGISEVYGESAGVLRRINLDTKEIEDLIEGQIILQVQIFDGKLYYLESTNNGTPSTELIRADLDGKNTEMLSEQNVLASGGQFYFNDENIILLDPRNYATDAANNVHVVNIESGSKVTLKDSFIKLLNGYSGIHALWPDADSSRVYFVAEPSEDHEEDQMTWIYYLTGQAVTKVMENVYVRTECVFDNTLYYLQSGTGSTGYSMELKRMVMGSGTKEKSKASVFTEEVFLTSSADNYVFQTTDDAVYLVVATQTKNSSDNMIIYINPDDYEDIRSYAVNR